MPKPKAPGKDTETGARRMRAREIRAGTGYGDGKKGKRLVLEVDRAHDLVRYEVIALTRRNEIHHVGGIYSIRLSNFAAWAVEIIHHPDTYLYDDDMEAPRPVEGRRRPKARVCPGCHKSKRPEAFLSGTGDESRPVCRRCYELGPVEAVKRGPQGDSPDQISPPVTMKTHTQVLAETQRPNDHGHAQAPVGEGKPQRYENVGRSCSAAKAEAARKNGRSGGRPPKWSAQTRTVAAQWLRSRLAEGGLGDEALEGELLRLARALEEGKVR